MSANPEATPLATSEQAPVQPGTPAPAAMPEATQGEPQVKTFFSKKAKAEAPREPLPDISKLPPEMQNVWKSFQADYTKKREEDITARKEWEAQRAQEQSALKTEREAMQRSQDAILEAIRGRAPAEGVGPADPLSQVQALRAEGRYEEADKLMLDYVQKVAQEQVAPIRRDAEAAKLQSTFQATAMNVMASNPVVAEYKDYVVGVFDSATPVMQKLRSVALSSPENVQAFVPMILNAIATEKHAQVLEASNAQLQEQIKKLSETNSRAKARSVPPSLVTSSGMSRETQGSGGGLAGALSRASEKLQGV